MKKNLRLLCLGLAAATVTCGFAQDDKTSLLKNADMEQGVKGWSFDGVDVVGKNTKNPSTQIGFHGMSKGVQEAWHSDPNNPLGGSYVMQRLSNLPSGTYVFGAYAAAAKQNTRVVKTLEDGTTQETVWTNRDSINGVVLFANDATVRVATDNPDLSARGHFFGHSSKFNVAVTLKDNDPAKGYLNVGMRVGNTNANYIVWDNATLYYFGKMSEKEALDAMAEIDMTHAAAIADTLVALKMNVDTLANLEAAIAAAGKKTSTAASLWEDSKEIHQAAGLARKSITDYTNLKKNIESATKVYENPVWQDGWTYEDYAGLLEEQLDAAAEAYEEASLDRAGLTELRNKLNWYVGALKYDSLYTAQDDLKKFITAVKDAVGKPGGYSAMQLASLESLQEELNDTCDYFEEIFGEEYDEEYFNPNNLWPYVARVYAAIEDVKNNPLAGVGEYTTMPIEIPAGEEGRVEGATQIASGAYKDLWEYKSPLYTFANPVERFKITVKKAAGGASFFSLSKLAFFDGDGNVIELKEENVSSEYDHNKINGEGADGQGVPGMLDDDPATYFHSAWANIPAGYHSIDVTLPNGGYSTFSFQMISRKGQPHQFPGEIMINAPMPKREALEATLARAQALNAYSGSEVGFYASDFSYLTDAVAEVVVALEGYPSEEECEAMEKNLKKQINNFEAAEDKSVNLPVEGKAYHLVSGEAGFYNKQFVEKAMTVHTDSIKSLWWETANSESLIQKFVFDPIMEDGEQYIWVDEQTNDDGTVTEIPYYAYTVKNVGTGLYVDSAFIDNKLRVVEQATDTVFLKSLGRGQWNIIVSGKVLHAGDNGGGAPGGDGAYGGTYGLGSGIVAWGGGIDSPSAWFIREMPELPLTALVSAGKYKSECYHFNPANTITLTANKACAFANLAIYDLLGNAIEAEVVVEGNKATLTTVQNIVGCAFAFTNNEGVSSVSFNAYQFTAAVELLQAAYDAAVAVAPVEGKDVMQYADITEYSAAIVKAEAMLENGAATEEEIDAMIAELEAAVAALVPNMPEAGKYYYIYSALDKFEANHGYKMAIYTKEDKVFWAQENECEWNRYWQLEPATVAELNALKVDSTLVAYYIKSVATGKYIGKVDGKSSQIPMASAKPETVPYTITSLQQGNAVAIAGANDASNRLHGAGHGEGKNKSGSIVYWNSGLGTASMWAISEAQYDATDIDFTEIEEENKAVVKGTFDLFGRRVVAPTAPGIYIIDGRKKLVK